MSFILKNDSHVLDNPRWSEDKSDGDGLALLLPVDGGPTQKSNSFGLPAFSGAPIKIPSARRAITLRILATAVLIFVCYFTIGLQLAVVPPA
jgi:hypothetical protein